MQTTGRLDSEGETDGVDKDVEEGSKSTRKIVVKNKLSMGFSEMVYKEGQKECWLICF